MKITDPYSFSKQAGMAVMIATGIEKARDNREFLASWQYIYDSGLYDRLQDWYKCRIDDMIREGILDA